MLLIFFFQKSLVLEVEGIWRKFEFPDEHLNSKDFILLDL